MRSEMKVNLAGPLFDEVALDGVPHTSGFIDTADASELALAYSHTNDSATSISFEVDWYRTGEGSPQAFESLGGTPASNGTDMVMTLEPDRYARAVSGDQHEAFTIPCKMRYCKIRISAAPSATASDLLSAWVTLIKTA
jgi:hypothetical protein